MARAAVRRSAWLICNKHSFNAASPRLATKLPTDSAPMVTKLPSLPPYFLIINRGFRSNVKASGSGKINLGGKGSGELTDLLKSYGFSEVHIDEIIRKFPTMLSLKVSTNLKPKLDYLVECGFDGSVLHRIIASNPFILGRNLESFLKPRYQFLKTYHMENVNMVIRRCVWLMSKNSLETGIEYLEKQGVPASGISKLLASSPCSLVYSRNRLVKLVEAIKALGIEPSANTFNRHFKTVSSMSETTWKKKVDVFESLGWSDEDVRATLMHYPTACRVSEEKLRRNMDFYINNVKTEPKAIISYPKLLEMSLNQRIIPRYEVMKLLKEHNLLKGCKVSSFFMKSEAAFMRKCIEKNLGQVPHLLEVYYAGRKAKSDTAI